MSDTGNSKVDVALHYAAHKPCACLAFHTASCSRGSVFCAAPGVQVNREDVTHAAPVFVSCWSSPHDLFCSYSNVFSVHVVACPVCMTEHAVSGLVLHTCATQCPPRH
jgi:hypothetical protein